MFGNLVPGFGNGGACMEDDDMPGRVNDRVVQILAEVFGVDKEKIVPGTNLEGLHDRNVLSLDVIELWMLLEEQFDIHIPEKEIGKWRTVADIIEYLQGRLSD